MRRQYIYMRKCHQSDCRNFHIIKFISYKRRYTNCIVLYCTHCKLQDFIIIWKLSSVDIFKLYSFKNQEEFRLLFTRNVMIVPQYFTTKSVSNCQPQGTAQPTFRNVMTSYSTPYNFWTLLLRIILARTIITALLFDTRRRSVYVASTFLRIEETTCGKLLKNLIYAATLQ